MLCIQSHTFATKKDVITAVCACTLAGQEAVVYSMSNCMFIQSGSPSVGGRKVKKPPFFHTVSIGMQASIGFRDGLGIMARFRDISHLHYNTRDHTVIVCETGNHCIRRMQLSEGYVVKTICGLGPQQKGYRDGGFDVAQFNAPHSCCVGLDGHIYVADCHNDAVRQIDMQTLLVSTIFGQRALVSYQSDRGVSSNKLFLSRPTSLRISRGVFLMVIHTGPCRIYRLEIALSLVPGRGRWVRAMDWTHTPFDCTNIFSDVSAMETTAQGKLLVWRNSPAQHQSPRLCLHDENTGEMLLRLPAEFACSSFCLINSPHRLSVGYAVQPGHNSVVEFRMNIKWEYKRVLFLGIVACSTTPHSQPFSLLCKEHVLLIIAHLINQSLCPLHSHRTLGKNQQAAETSQEYKQACIQEDADEQDNVFEYESD